MAKATANFFPLQSLQRPARFTKAQRLHPSHAQTEGRRGHDANLDKASTPPAGYSVLQIKIDFSKIIPCSACFKHQAGLHLNQSTAPHFTRLVVIGAPPIPEQRLEIYLPGRGRPTSGVSPSASTPPLARCWRPADWQFLPGLLGDLVGVRGRGYPCLDDTPLSSRGGGTDFGTPPQSHNKIPPYYECKLRGTPSRWIGLT